MIFGNEVFSKKERILKKSRGNYNFLKIFKNVLKM